MTDGEWPLVGRASELSRLTRLLDQGTPGALLVGGPGVGKTRLAEEVLRLAAQRGHPTNRVIATRGSAGIPLGALATALPEANLDPPSATASARALRAYADALIGSSPGRPVVFLADDAHYLDDASATVLLHAVLSKQAFVLAVLREGAPVPAPLATLWQDELLETLSVSRLDPASLEEAITVALGGPVDPASIVQLTELADGDTLVVRDLIRAAVDGGRLRDDGGIWRLTGRVSLPPSVIERVEGGLRQLGPDERALMELVAFGQPLGSAEVHALTEPKLVDQLERQGLLSCRMSERRLEIRLARVLHGEVLRAQLTIVTRHSMATQLADVVESHGARRADDVLRDAVWRLEGDGANPELLLTAATQARARKDFALSERLARAAVRAGAGFDARLLAAQMAADQGRNDQADAEFATLAEQAKDDADRGLLAVARVSHQLYKIADFDKGLAVADAALETITNQGWRDEITALTAGVVMSLKGAKAAADLVRPLLAGSTGRTLVSAALFASMSLGRLGRFGEALEASSQGYDLHLRTPDPVGYDPATHLVYRADALAHAGRIGEADSLATHAYQKALAEGSSEGRALLAFHLAKTVGDRGNVGTAALRAREAVAIFRDLDRPRQASGALIYLAMSLALAGKPGEAEEILNSPDAPGPSTKLFSSAVDLHLAWTWTAIAGSDLPQARQLLDNAVAMAQRIDDAVGESVAWHTQARLGNHRAALPHLERLAQVIEGDLIGARAAHARALTARDPEALESVSESFATMGADLLAAEAAADAAVAWRRSNDTRRAAAAERLAGVLVVRCEGVSTPALRAIESRVQLTPAEQEAATMAASGRSNREIAAALCLSVRTVENQLQRAYHKLGVTSRAELAEVLAQRV